MTGVDLHLLRAPKRRPIAEVSFSRGRIFDETDGHEEKLRLRVSFAKLSLVRTRMRPVDPRNLLDARAPAQLTSACRRKRKVKQRSISHARKSGKERKSRQEKYHTSRTPAEVPTRNIHKALRAQRSFSPASDQWTTGRRKELPDATKFCPRSSDSLRKSPLQLRTMKSQNRVGPSRDKHVANITMGGEDDVVEHVVGEFQEVQRTGHANHPRRCTKTRLGHTTTKGPHAKIQQRRIIDLLI